MAPFLSEGAGSWQVWTFTPFFSIYIGFLVYLIFVKLDTQKFESLHKQVRKYGKNSRNASNNNSNISSPRKTQRKVKEHTKYDAPYGNLLDVPLIDPEYENIDVNLVQDNGILNSTSSKSSKTKKLSWKDTPLTEKINLHYNSGQAIRLNETKQKKDKDGSNSTDSNSRDNQKN